MRTRNFGQWLLLVSGFLIGVAYFEGGNYISTHAHWRGTVTAYILFPLILLGCLAFGVKLSSER